MEHPTNTNPNTQQQAWHRLCDLIHQAIKPIPRHHRLGWWQTTLRHQQHPLTNQPTPAELEYLTWSLRYLNGPRRQHSHQASPKGTAVHRGTPAKG